MTDLKKQIGAYNRIKKRLTRKLKVNVLRAIVRRKNIWFNGWDYKNQEFKIERL